VRRLGVVALLAPPSLAWGQSEAPASAHGTPYYLLQALLSLAVVVALIYVSYYLMRRLQERATPSGKADALIEILDARHLGAGRWLYLVQVAGEQFLVGSGPQGVGPLARVAPKCPTERVVGSEEGRDASQD
jgi:flagellar biosynthetic protein FliO